LVSNISLGHLVLVDDESDDFVMTMETCKIVGLKDIIYQQFVLEFVFDKLWLPSPRFGEISRA
jgi:hypothetical protein